MGQARKNSQLQGEKGKDAALARRVVQIFGQTFQDFGPLKSEEL
jgi:hypothetical protein